MHHYPHHISDFNNATRHLTRVERCLYREAIELYYDTELPLPGGDFEWLSRRLLAISDEEKDALRSILGEFFTLEDGCYRNKRCDLEIAKYRANTDKKKKAGLASVEARKVRKKNNLTGVEHVLNGCATDEEQTKNQEPRTNIEESKLSNSQANIDCPSPPINKFDAEAKMVIEFLNQKTGRRYRPVKAHVRLISARLKEGATMIECKQVIAKKCREWSSDEKMEQYLRPGTLFNASNFANYLGEIGND